MSPPLHHLTPYPCQGINRWQEMFTRQIDVEKGRWIGQEVCVWQLPGYLGSWKIYSRDCGWPRRPWPNAGCKKLKNYRKKRIEKNYLNKFFFCIYLLVMPKYWEKQIFTHWRFPEVGQKQKTERERKEEKLNDGDNNGQATHGARKHAWRTQAAWAKIMASYASVRHHRWSTQAIWTIFEGISILAVPQIMDLNIKT